ncbi:MAG: class I SAM-dependent methyltransferase [Acidobacteriota bacterium]
MPHPLPADPEAAERIRRRYALERRLADRIREAPAARRPTAVREAYDTFFREAEPSPPDPAEVELQAAVLAPWIAPGTRLLDFGAGSGALARRMAAGGAQVVALEASHELVARARARGDEGLDGIRWLTVEEAEDGGLAPGSVDLAWSCHVVEHLHPDDLQPHLRQLHHWLAAGGHALLATPSRLWGPHDVSRYFDRRATGFHLREYTHGELARSLSHAGFVEPRPLDLSGRPRPLASTARTERLLGLLPPPVRALALQRLARGGRPEPLRPLEQVLLVARRL